MSLHDPLALQGHAVSRTCDSPLLQSLFAFDVAARELRGRGSPDWLLPEELAAIRSAVPARIAEFAAGRRCAREALRALGALGVLAESPLLRGPHREPLWPSGVRGSITHTEGYCAAVVAPVMACAGIGIDAELCGRVGEDLWPALFDATEVAALLALDAQRRTILATILFAAKEAFFKSQHALTGAVPDFPEVGFRLDAPLEARGAVVLARVADSRLEGLRSRARVRYAVEGTLVVAGVAIGMV